MNKYILATVIIVLTCCSNESINSSNDTNQGYINKPGHLDEQYLTKVISDIRNQRLDDIPSIKQCQEASVIIMYSRGTNMCLIDTPNSINNNKWINIDDAMTYAISNIENKQSAVIVCDVDGINNTYKSYINSILLKRGYMKVYYHSIIPGDRAHKYYHDIIDE